MYCYPVHANQLLYLLSIEAEETDGVVAGKQYINMEKERSQICIYIYIRYKSSLHLNFRTITAIDFLFSPLHTTLCNALA